jgi:hypothetical protein
MLNQYYFLQPKNKLISSKVLSTRFPPLQLENVVSIVQLVLGSSISNKLWIDSSDNGGVTAANLDSMGFNVQSVNQNNDIYDTNLNGTSVQVVTEIHPSNNSLVFLDLISQPVVPKINTDVLPVYIISGDLIDDLPLEEYQVFEYTLSTKDFYEDLSKVDSFYKNDLKLLSKSGNFKLFILKPRQMSEVMIQQDLYESNSDYETRIVISSHIIEKFPKATPDVVTMLSAALIQKLRTGQIFCQPLESVIKFLLNEDVSQLFFNYESILQNLSIQKQSLLQTGLELDEEVDTTTTTIQQPSLILNTTDMLLDQGERVEINDDVATWVQQTIESFEPKFTLIEGISDEGIVSEKLRSSSKLSKINLFEKPYYKEYQYFIFSTNPPFLDTLNPKVKVFKTTFTSSVLPNSVHKKILFLNPSVLNSNQPFGSSVLFQGKSMDEFTKELFKLPNAIAPNYIVIQSRHKPLPGANQTYEKDETFLSVYKR